MSRAPDDSGRNSTWAYRRETDVAMHHRSEKNSHLDTILYEIDMLRHCAQSITQKRAEEQISDSARAEYYLAIEGFLLHLRNLLAFFTKGKTKPTDLVVNEPAVWAGKDIEQTEYSGLIKLVEEFNLNYSVTVDETLSSCYLEISKFLQHCTTLRYERAKQWPIEQMYTDIEPVLAEFEGRFAESARSVRRGENISGTTDNSTATFRTLGHWSDNEK